MNKTLASILAAALAVSLTACSGNISGGSSGNSPEPPPVEEVSLSGEIGGEITVSAYDTMRYKAFLEDAARLFEEKYPGTKVNVETFSAMPEVKTSEQGDQKISVIEVKDDPQSRQDYINQVNTAMMSGGGADVLAMDILPIHKYADGGQLENLAAYMQADPEFNRADYRGNILDAVEYKNGTWFMPIDYTFDYYAYDSTLLSAESAGFGTGSAFSTEELIRLAESAFDGSAKLFNTMDYLKGGGGMWGNLLAEHYASFVDVETKTASFADGRFASLLESVKQYGEQGYLPQGAALQSDAGEMMRPDRQAPSDRFFYKPQNVFSLTAQFTRGTGRKMNIMMGGVMAIDDDDEIAGIAANADGSVPFTYNQAYGINANSQNKETAWAFLKFLLSEEMQLNTNLMPTALPLLHSAREKKAELVFSGAFMGFQGEPLDDAQKAALGEYVTAVEALSDQINRYTWVDAVVGDMIAAEVGYFFEGSKTAEEVAGVLQSKVDLYLNE